MARRIEVAIAGDASSLIRAFGRASASATGFDRRVNSVGRSAHRGLTSNLRLAAGSLIGGYGIVSAFTSTIGKAAEFQRSMNVLQAVSGATARQMAAAGAEARKLGGDITLPATSAKDAAEAMVELSKGGLSVASSMAAAKGTLQLAAAANIDAASAAQIQVNALNQFGLSGGQATKVADVLANAANAASGEITDMATALTYVGPVAAGMGVSITDTGTAVALLGKNGILADKAGTGLRAMLASLAKPTSQNVAGFKLLGINAFDSAGHFLGFRKVIAQLHDAQGRMTQQQFTMAAALAFGRIPLAQVIALAKEGPSEFDKMRSAVGKQGGAARVAAARNKGFAGAMDGLKSAIETVQIQLGSALLPMLTKYVRAASTWLSSTKNQQKIMHGFRQVMATVGSILRTVRAIIQGLNRVTGSFGGTLKLLIGTMIAFKALKFAGTVAGIARSFGLLGGKARGANTAMRGARGGANALRLGLVGKAGLVVGAGVAAFALTSLILKVTGLDKKLRAAGGAAFDAAAKFGLVNDPTKQFKGKAGPGMGAKDSQNRTAYIKAVLARLERAGMTPQQAADSFLKTHKGVARHDVEVYAGVYGVSPGVTRAPIQVHTTVNLDGKVVAKNTTEHQRKHAKRNTTQRGGRLAGAPQP